MRIVSGIVLDLFARLDFLWILSMNSLLIWCFKAYPWKWKVSLTNLVPLHIPVMLSKLTRVSFSCLCVHGT